MAGSARVKASGRPARPAGTVCADGALLVGINLGNIRAVGDGAVIHVRGKGNKDRRVPIEYEGVRSGMDMARRISSPVAHELRERIHMIRLTAANEDTETLPLTVDALRDWGWLY